MLGLRSLSQPAISRYHRETGNLMQQGGDSNVPEARQGDAGEADADQMTAAARAYRVAVASDDSDYEGEWPDTTQEDINALAPHLEGGDLQALASEFVQGTLQQSELRRLPRPLMKAYLRWQLKVKWGRPVRFSCVNCAMTALYNEDGAVTDDEIIEATGMPHM
jgi:hypothetical protein